MTELLKSRMYQPNDKNKDIATELITLLKTSDKKNKNDNNDDKDGDNISNNSTVSTLTLSDVLNILDGIYTLDNYVITFSTNHIEKLDPAFLRDQRITHKIEFKNCSRNILKEIIEQWYKVKLSEKDLIKLKDNSFTLANIVTLCDKCDTAEQVISLL
jgi:ATP-dependent 26S proteasome regulatory subunit